MDAVNDTNTTEETNGSSTIVAVDSLTANEFEVEIDGEKTTGIFRVSGLTTFRLGTTYEKSVLITKMVQRDGSNAFNRWIQETIAAGGDMELPRRKLTIVAVDDGVPVRRWNLNNAYIVAVSYTDFDSASTEMVEEMLTIQYDTLEQVFATS